MTIADQHSVRLRPATTASSDRLWTVFAIPLKYSVLVDCLVLTAPLLLTILIAKMMMLMDVIFPLGLATFEMYLSFRADFSIVEILLIPGFLVVLVFGLRILARRYGRLWLFTGFVVAGALLGLIAVLADASQVLRDLPIVGGLADYVKVLFDVLRWDFLFILCVLLSTAWALTKWPTGRVNARVRWWILGIQAPLVLLASLEFAYFLKTGVTGSRELFLYAATHAIDIAPIVASEFDGIVFAIIVVPLITAVAIGAWTKHARKPADRTLPAGYFAWPVALLLIMAPKLNSNAHYFQFEQNIHLTLAEGLIATADSAGNSWRAARSRHQSDLLFDTSKLALKETSSWNHSNVILVILESVGANSTSLAGTGLDNTPFLEALAKESTVIDQMYVVVPRTLASWISILQGVYPAASNVTLRWGDKLERAGGQYPSLPNLLKPFGYQSAFFTPTHLDYENEKQIISNMGFDFVMARDDYDAGGFELVNYFGWEDRIMSQPIVDWVDSNASRSSPIFLTVMTNVGHHDYSPPASWPRRDYGSPLGDAHNDYLNSLAYIDAFLADLFDSLRQRGVFDNSLVVIVGDHGESFGEHGKNHHMAVMYEESLHVPAIIRSTSISHDDDGVDGLWQLPDIFPTIIDGLGLEFTGGSAPGRSVFAGPQEERRAYFAGSLDNSYLGMRAGDLKYIYYYGRRPTEVFDLSNDPEEQHDISHTIDDSRLRVVERELLSWYRSTSAALLEDK